MLTVSDFLHRCDAAVCNVPNALADFQVRPPARELPACLSR